MPKNGSDFTPQSFIRIELPAQGYLNTANTVLIFDVELTYYPVTNDGSIIRFQNNIQSIFDNVRLMYGSTPLEQIIGYNQLVRSLTEWTTNGTMDQASCADGIAEATTRLTGTSNDGFGFSSLFRGVRTGPVNGRQLTQGISQQSLPDTVAGLASQNNPELAGKGFGTIPTGQIYGDDRNPSGGSITVVRRYAVQLNLGLFQQGKLLPIKYMASQLAIEIQPAPATDCILWHKGYAFTANETVTEAFGSTAPSYVIKNMVLLPEILEFDSTYDATFLQGLKQGVPILFSSWNTFYNSLSNQNAANINIPERNRSIKSIFTLQTRQQKTITEDAHASFYTSFASTDAGNSNGGPLQQFQYRIGSRYFPAAPVQCTTTVMGDTSNGGAEAWVELAKAVNVLGDYRLSLGITSISWAMCRGMYYQYYPTAAPVGWKVVLPEYDGRYGLVGVTPTSAIQYVETEAPIRWVLGTFKSDEAQYAGRAFFGDRSSCFVMAQSLETSNGMEISGLNAEEQSDITLMATWKENQSNGIATQLVTYTYYDAMLVLFENNVIQLIK